MPDFITSALATTSAILIAKRKQSGRIIGFLAIALALFQFPLGTIFGICAIFVLKDHDLAIELDKW